VVTSPAIPTNCGRRPPSGALSETLSEAVAAAAYEFITGPLLTDPHRTGKRLLPPMDDRFSARRGTYRVIYRIDDKARVVTAVDVAHRHDAYRRHLCSHQADHSSKLVMRVRFPSSAPYIGWLLRSSVFMFECLFNYLAWLA
jgi:mRNA interferase RelE/StbE